MGLGSFALLAGIVLIGRLIQKIGESTKAPPRQRLPGEAPQTMAELLVDMRRQLEMAQEKPAEPQRTVQKRLPPNTTVPQRPQRAAASARREQGGSPKRLPREVAERGGSIESASREVQEIVVDRDDEVEALVQRRIDAATSRNGAWQASDHRRFDEAIRSAPPAVPVPKPRTGLRQAMIWREVLSPPVALREDEER